MAYIVFSHYECVGAGEMPQDGEAVSVLGSRPDAMAWFDSQLAALLASVTAEIERVTGNDKYVFDSPYIVWVLMLRLDACDSSVELDNYMAELCGNAEDPDAAISRNVERYSGWTFDELRKSKYSVSEAVSSLVDFYAA